MQAIYDVWFIGDQFFRDMFPSLQNLKQQAKLLKTPIPYLYEYYNVFGYYSMVTSGIRCAIARVYNSLVVGLNTRECLPRLIVIMLDKDIIEDVSFHGHYETDDVITKNIEWLFRQISIVIKRKHAELSDKKPGAVYSLDPKVVVVDMLKRPLQFPNDSNMQLIAQLRSCYNSIVNDAAQHFGFNRMYIESCSS